MYHEFHSFLCSSSFLPHEMCLPLTNYIDQHFGTQLIYFFFFIFTTWQKVHVLLFSFLHQKLLTENHNKSQKKKDSAAK